MNSDQLRQFRAIAECGNLTNAAAKLFITQPALSVSLTELEAEIGKLLFVRKGRSMILTENGEKLLTYAVTVTDAIDEAREYFRVPEEMDEVLIYRIGGVAAPLLLSGSYNLNYRLKLKLVHNYETPAIVGQAIAEFIIADERYMNAAIYKGVEKEFLYDQKLLLSVRENDPLAGKEKISVKELEEIHLIGHYASKGINDWIADVEKDNRISLNVDMHFDYAFYEREAASIPWPFLMSSFGEGMAADQPYMKGRKQIEITGEYTHRSIWLWYDNRIKRLVQPYINLITSNAQRISEIDRKYKEKE